MTDETTSQSDSPAKKRGGVPLVGAIVVLLLIAVMGRACYVWIDGGDEFDLRRFAFLGEQELVYYDVQGTVSFNGTPVDHGHVEAIPLKKEGQPDRIIGPIQEDGSFELYSDVGGKLTPGAVAGKYKLLLIVHHPTRPLEAPSPILPDEYYDESKTPIEITVTSDPQQNNFDLKETGEIQANPRGPARDEKREDAPTPAE